MGMDVYSIRYRKPDGTEFQTVVPANDAREAKRLARSIAQEKGWVALLNEVEVWGKPLSMRDGVRNHGHRSLKKEQKKFSCVFRDLDGRLEEDVFEAYDTHNAKTVAREIGRTTGLQPLVKSIKAYSGS